MPPTNPLIEALPPTNPLIKALPPTNPLIEALPPTNPLIEALPATTSLIEALPPTNPLIEALPPTNPLIEALPATTPLIEAPPPATLTQSSMKSTKSKVLESIIISQSLYDAMLRVLRDEGLRSLYGHDTLILLTILVQYRKYEVSCPAILYCVAP